MLLSLPASEDDPISEDVRLPDIFRAIDAGEICQISRYNNEEDKLLLNAYIIKAISLINRAYNFPMGQGAIAMISEKIKANYWNLTIDDLFLFARQACDGYFGKVYGTLNVPTVMEWIDRYSSDRFDAIEAEQYIVHQNSKEEGRYRESYFDDLAKQMKK